MFVEYFSHVEGSLIEVEDALLATVDLVPEWAEHAYRNGEDMRVRIGPRTEQSAIAKKVRLQIGSASRGNGAKTFPLYWEAVGTPGLFPKMTGDLVLAPVGSNLTQVKLRGSYEPPLGAAGKTLDRYVFHRFAEASVKDFVDRIVAALQARTRAQSGN